MQYISEYQEDIMDLLSREKTGKVERPVRVLQFGEGNFLRAFVDYMIDIANEQGKFNGDIVLVKPIEFEVWIVSTSRNVSIPYSCAEL